MKGEFLFNSENGKWNFILDKKSDFGIYNATSSIEISGKEYTPGDADSVKIEKPKVIKDKLGKRELLQVNFIYNTPGFIWKVFFEQFFETSTVIIHSELQNISSSSLTLGKCNLISISSDKEGKIYLGKNHSNQTVFVFSGTQGLNYVKDISSDNGKHLSQTIFHIYNRESKIALNSGFLTFDRIETRHSLKYSSEKGIEHYNGYCDFLGFNLPSGKTITSEKLFLELDDNPFRTLERWAEFVKIIYNPPLPPKVPAGWAGYAWVEVFTFENPEDVVLRNCRAIRKRLKGFDIDYIWISIANLEDYMPGKWLKINRESFPHFEKMIKQLKKLKFKPGFWIAPFWIASAAKEELERNKGNLLMMKNGQPSLSCRKWTFAYGKFKQEFDLYRLDGSHPKSIQFIKEVFGRYRKMGIRYYMIDFLEAGAVREIGRYDKESYDEYFDKSMVKGPEVYRNLLKAIRKAAGKDTHLLPSTGPTFDNVGLVEAVRIGNDYGEGRPVFNKEFNPATFIINNPDHWTSHKYALQNMATTYFTHNRLYLNDINMMTVDKPISRNNAEITATMFGISGSPLMMGDDIERIHPERLELIKKCLPRTSECARPVDLFTSIYPYTYPKIFILPLKTNWGEWFICAIFNFDRTLLKLEISLEELGLASGINYHLYDFWNEEYLGVISDCLAVDIPKNSCKLLRIEKTRPYPWVLSTDMHILQGYVELASVKWDKNSFTLKGIAMRPKGEKGNIFVIAPKGYKLKDYSGLWVAKDGNNGSLIIRKEINFRKNKEKWELPFSKIDEK